MVTKKLMNLAGLLVVVAMLVTACAPTATPAVENTQAPAETPAGEATTDPEPTAASVEGSFQIPDIVEGQFNVDRKSVV